MIKRLDSKYEKKVIDYLNIEKEINTFNLQELKNYGFDNVFYKVYSDIDEDGNIKGILFKCFEYLTFYSYGEFDVDKFCEFIISDIEFNEISGKTECVEAIARKLGLLKYRKVHLCRLDYIDDIEAMSKFGIIEDSETWDDITLPENLLRKGKELLKSNNRIKKKYSISALDLSLIGLDLDNIDIYNKSLFQFFDDNGIFYKINSDGSYTYNL